MTITEKNYSNYFFFYSDITYSRHTSKGLCDDLEGCKCNTAKCSYGDACLCDEKVEGCPPNTTLNQAGGMLQIEYINIIAGHAMWYLLICEGHRVIYSC